MAVKKPKDSAQSYGKRARHYLVVQNLRALVISLVLGAVALLLFVVAMPRAKREHIDHDNWGRTRAFSYNYSPEHLLKVFKAGHAAFKEYIKRDLINPQLDGLEKAFNTVRSEADLLAALQELVSISEDPYAEVLTAREYADRSARQSGKRIGVEIDMNFIAGAGWTVSRCSPESAAGRAGIKIGDIVTTVDDTNLGTLSAPGMEWRAWQRISQMINNGMLASTVTFTVKRGEESIDIEVQRSIIGGDEALQSSDGWFQGKLPGVKSVRFPNLSNPQALPAFIELIDRLVKEESRGIVLDLSKVSGGDPEMAMRIAALVMDKGTIAHRIEVTATGAVLMRTWEVKEGKVVLRTRGPFAVNADGSLERSPKQPEKVENLDWPCNRFKGNVVVAVDQNTSGAAEIIVAALKQDLKRWVVVGTYWTAGKGMSQTYFNVGADLVVSLSTTFYLQPNGQVFEGEGVEPQRAPGDNSSPSSFAMAVMDQRLRILPKPELPPEPDK